MAYLRCQKFIMHKLSQMITQTAAPLDEHTTLSTEMFLHLADRRAVNRALADLTRLGTMARIYRGIYVRVLQSRFGSYLPPAYQVVKHMAAASGDTVVPHGAAAANRMGLTTQVPMREFYLTTGRPRTLKFRKAAVVLTRAPRWMFTLGDEPAGTAIRALAWMGEPRVKLAVARLHRTLSSTDWERLKAVTPSLPSWMAEAINQQR